MGICFDSQMRNLNSERRIPEQRNRENGVRKWYSWARSKQTLAT